MSGMLGDIPIDTTGEVTEGFIQEMDTEAPTEVSEMSEEEKIMASFENLKTSKFLVREISRYDHLRNIPLDIQAQLVNYDLYISNKNVYRDKLEKYLAKLNFARAQMHSDNRLISDLEQLITSLEAHKKLIFPVSHQRFDAFVGVGGSYASPEG